MKGHVMDSACEQSDGGCHCDNACHEYGNCCEDKVEFVAMNLHPDTILPRLPFFLNLQTFPLGLAPLHHTMTYTLLNQDQELT